MPLTNTTDGSLRSLRITHGTVLVAMVLLVYTAEVLTPHEPRDLGRILPIVFGIVSLQVIGITLYFRTTKIRPALEILQMKPDDPTALQQWRFDAILTAVLLESIVLYGFALRFLGAPAKTSWLFYSVGIVLMFFWWPQRP
jgi:hypothetical protein